MCDGSKISEKNILHHKRSSFSAVMLVTAQLNLHLNVWYWLRVVCCQNTITLLTIRPPFQLLFEIKNLTYI